MSFPPPSLQASDPNQASSEKARSRWKLARERLIVDKKGQNKLLEVHLKKRAHTDKYGISARVRPQANGHPGLVLWEEPTSGLLSNYNADAKSHLKVKKYSLIVSINGKTLNGEMFAELQAMDEITLQVRVPSTGIAGASKHFDDVMAIALPLSRVKANLKKAASDKQGATASAAPAAPAAAAAAAGGLGLGGESNPSAAISADPANGEQGEVDPEVLRKQQELQGEEMGEMVKETLEKEIESENKGTASTDIDEETGESIESFLSDPQAFRIMQQMLVEEGANGSATMRQFMDEVSSYHIDQMKKHAHGFFSSFKCSCGPSSGKSDE